MFARQTFFPLVAVYAILGTAWAVFAHRIAPDIIVAAYSERSFSILNRLCEDNRDLPVNHYLTCWEVFAGALEIAMALHFILVLFIGSIDRKHKLQHRDAAQTGSTANFLLIALSAAFLGTTAMTGSIGDYVAYTTLWTSILDGRNPWTWNFDELINAYGPLFNVLAPTIWFNPLSNKLLFAFSYLVYVIWLIKDHGPRCDFGAPSWSCFALLLLNLLPWVQIAYLGYFDVLVGLACVASVHSLVRRKDLFSGTYLALGILLKFMPIVILPFLAFDGSRFHFRLVGCCLLLVAVGFLASVLVWGTSTFAPLAFAATRNSDLSIYDVMNSTHSPLRAIWDTPHAELLEKPLLMTAGLSLFLWCAFRQIKPILSATLIILITLLLYRVAWSNYYMAFLCMVVYWTVSEWYWLRKKTAWTTLLILYFTFLAVADFPYIRQIAYSGLVINLLQFLLGCTVLAGLIWLSSLSAGRHESSNQLQRKTA